MWRAKDVSSKLTTPKPSKPRTLDADAAATALMGTPPPPKTGNGSPSASAKAAPDGKRVADDSGASMFVLAYGIAHDGGGVMRCRWPPESLRARARTGAGASTRSAADTAAAAAEGQGAEALGLLAAVFYDGSIR